MEFNEIVRKVKNEAYTDISKDYSSKSIGAIAEKLTHRVLKYYIDNNEEHHEVRVDGVIADVVTEDGVIHEVQSKDFYKLRYKLTRLLIKHKVELVIPIVNRKELHWIDKVTGECVGVSKSSRRKFNPWILVELHGISDLCTNPNLSFRCIGIEEIEYKYQDGHGKNNRNHATKIDRIPNKLLDDVKFENYTELAKLVPFGPDEIFTSTDFSKKTGIMFKNSQVALKLLYDLGIVDRIDRDKYGYKYKLKQEN